MLARLFSSTVDEMTYVLVGDLLFFVPLLVLLRLVLIWLAIFFAQGLPFITKHFTDLACFIVAVRYDQDEQC